MSDQTSLTAKVARLKDSFISQLPRRVSELQEHFSQLPDHATRDSPTLHELHRCWHSLKGASRVFGLNELAKIAAEGEASTQILLEQRTGTITPAWQQEQNDIIALLSDFAGSIQLGQTDARTSFQVPYFEMSQVIQDWQQTGPPLVYICDDEAEQVEYLEYQLQCFGYEIRRFTDVASFEQAVMEQKPDAVIMDVHFPHGNTAGTETLHLLNQQLGYQLPSLVLSGVDTFEARLSAYRAGCHNYFLKPAKPLELANALDRLIRTQATDPYQVLIVDDEPDIAEYHSLILENAGMQVRQVHDPAQVLNVLREFAADLVLVDVYMPGCTGYELAGVIRQVPEYLGISIIYLSSETDRQKQFNAMQVGVEGFITKPVAPYELVNIVSQRVERMRALRGLMTRDSLTGLYNHSASTDIISSILAQTNRTHEPLVLAALDLDLFKQVNDNYGHLAGDQVLLALSHMLKNRLRSGDIIGRYGGEEFIILLRNTGLEAARGLLDQLREEFSRIVFAAGNETFHCTFSAGLSSYDSYSTLDELMAAADSALYAAKRTGRNRVASKENRT